jgi:hypothetical protein
LLLLLMLLLLLLGRNDERTKVRLVSIRFIGVLETITILGLIIDIGF